MPAALTLYQYPGLRPNATLSPPCGKVHMALAFKGLPYEVVDLRSPFAVRRRNPRGRVPVLAIGHELVVDSTDILTALDTHFPDTPLLPEGARERARALLWEDWADEVLYFYVVYLRWHTEAGYRRVRTHGFPGLRAPMRWLIPPLARRIARTRLRGQGLGVKDETTVRRELRTALGSLETLLADTPFLAGEEPSRADLAVCAVVDQLAIERLTPEVAKEIAALDRVGAWRERVHDLAPPAV